MRKCEEKEWKIEKLMKFVVQQFIITKIDI